MAKLTNVKYPNEVVEVEGVKYRKVERKAQAGDIVKALSSRTDITEGGFYKVVSVSGCVGFYDNINDFRTPTLEAPYFEVYEKVTEPAPQPERLKVGEYAKVVNGQTAYNSSIPTGSFVKIIEDDFGTVPFKIQALDEVTTRWAKPEHLARATESEVEAAKKKAQESAERAKKIGEFADGGYAVVVDSSKSTCLSGIKNGDYVTVKADDPNRNVYPLYVCGRNGGYCNADALRKVTREEYEAATKPKPVFSVGDYAKVTCDVMEFRKNDIVRITHDKSCGYISSSFDFKVDRIGKNTYGFISAKNIEKISAEEFARIEEEAKWAAIGRKVGEIKKGDVVQTFKGQYGHPIGTIGVAAHGGNATSIRVDVPGEISFHHSVRLIVPVEQRFDRAEGGASPSK